MSDAGNETRNKFNFCQQLGVFLDGESFRWNSFATFTFERAPARSPLCHYACIRVLVERGQPESTEASHAVFAERGTRNGRWHLHALIEHPGVSGGSLKREWEARYGWARVKQYDYKYGAGQYLSLYASKGLDDLADWALYTTHGSGAVPDLFTVAKRRTGYQLYTDSVRALRGRPPERGG